MRFKSRESASPEINLIPLMDVLMTVLTFFVLVSMGLNGEQISNINLPSQSGKPGELVAQSGPILVIGLTATGELTIESQRFSVEAAQQELSKRLKQEPNLALMLKADRTLPYKTVAKTLGVLRNLGGSRVSLVTQ
jgi:biopolymer transport protein ExbD